MKNSIGFVSGIIVGIAGVILAQQAFKAPDEVSEPDEQERGSLTARRQELQLTTARERIAELEDQLATTNLELEGGAVASRGDAPSAPARSEPEQAASFIEVMMSFGDDGAMRKVDAEVTRLSDILGLTENQQMVVREALIKKFDEQKAASVRIMTGAANISDLMISDEHNFVGLDAAIQPILDETQLELYGEEGAVREQNRIETKTAEELGQLTRAIELSEEQQDAAWAALAEINAAEPPGAIPDGTTKEEFFTLIDGAIGKRIGALEPVLSPAQLQVYQGQAGDFRDKILTLVDHAIGANALSPEPPAQP
jgi:hypothetical protein